jgi:tRNA/rRNA methyltransferase
MFARARLEKEEVNILRGMLGACEKQLQAAHQRVSSNGSTASPGLPD